jgi:ABC-2 type transport system permease protein
MGVVHIHVVRQFRRYLRGRGTILIMAGQPFLYFVALGFGLTPTFASAGQGSYVQFLAPGVVAMAVLFMAVMAGSDLMTDRRSGILRQTLVAPVPRLALVAGRTLGSALVATTHGCLVLVTCMVAGFRPAGIAAIGEGLAFMLVIAVIFSGIAVSLASRLRDVASFQLAFNFIVMPMFFFSGTLYPLAHLPPVIKALVAINPLTYGVDGLRGALNDAASFFGTATDLGIISTIAAVLMCVSSWLFSRLEL